MSNITFSLSLPPWLAQWYTNRRGGSLPIKLAKGSLESITVQKFSRKKSESDAPDIPEEGDLLIEIPDSKIKPAINYSFIPDSAKTLLYKTILEEFDFCMAHEIILPQFTKFSDTLKKNLIYSWMNENGIEFTETNWFGVVQRFDRHRQRLLNKERVKKSRKKL